MAALCDFILRRVSCIPVVNLYGIFNKILKRATIETWLALMFR